MNGNTFADKLYALRSAKGCSQGELACAIGALENTVIAWEAGASIPQLEVLSRLAEFFGVERDELLVTSNAKKTVTKIVLTGGPCAGKTTAMGRIKEELAAIGYHVVIVPETATELISGGITPWGLETNFDYQLYQTKLQIEKERIFTEAANLVLGKDKILVVCDRGTMDNKAYMSDSDFDKLLDTLEFNLTEFRDRYDAIFHLVSAAKGAEAFYTTDGNCARVETLEEAARLDDKMIFAWMGHPHLRVIDNSSDFKTKMDRLIAEIMAFLGEPEPYEIERKFLIEYPDTRALLKNPKCHKVEITQTYLLSDADEEIRVRRRGEDGHYVYFKTVKRTVSGAKREEIESKITADEYKELLCKADPERQPIEKDRYCLMHDNQYFEIDVYPFWSDRAIMEIELSGENDKISIPDYIRVIKEVTDDKSYKNSSLAKMKY